MPQRVIDPEQVRKYHALGWSDLEIGRTLGVTRKTIGEWRRRLRLPVNVPEDQPGCVKPVLRSGRIEHETQGITSDEERASIEIAIAAARRWHFCWTECQADLCDLLEAHFDLSIRELTDRSKWSKTQVMVAVQELMGLKKVCEVRDSYRLAVDAARKRPCFEIKADDWEKPVHTMRIASGDLYDLDHR